MNQPHHIIRDSQPLLVAMLGGPELVTLIWLALLAFWIWMIVDCARYEQDAKALWLVFIILLVVGAPVYFFARRLPRRTRQRDSTASTSPPDGHTDDSTSSVINPAQPPPPAGSRVSRLAVASVSLSALSIIIGPFGALPGIVCGHLAQSKMRRDPSLRGGGYANAGLAIGYLALAILTLVILAQVFRQK